MATPQTTPQKTKLHSSSVSLTSALSSRSSTFRGLVSSKNVKQKALPKFLREERSASRACLTLPFGPQGDASAQLFDSLRSAEEMNILSSHFSAIRTRSLLVSSPQKPVRAVPSAVSDNAKRREERVAEVLAAVMSEDGARDEELLRIGDIGFNRGELKGVIGRDVSRKVMQAYFKSLNRENRSRMDIQSVKIFSVVFSQEIFGKGRGATLHSKSDPLKYE